MPQISVIVPVYKVEPYIHRCVDSILGQTYTDFELILVDDGSPDRCPAICDEYREKDSRVVVIHQKNGGLSAARNAGIDWAFANSDSQWIYFADSDDWIHPMSLEALVKGAQETGVNIVVGGFDRTEKESPVVNTMQLSAAIWETETYFCEHNVNATVAWGKLYPKECFQKIRYPIGRIHEDEFITYQILFEYDHIAVINQPLYAYFQNPDGIMKSNSLKVSCFDGIDALAQQVKYFEERDNTKMYMDSIGRLRWLFNYRANLIKEEQSIGMNTDLRIILKQFRKKEQKYRNYLRIKDNELTYEVCFPRAMILYYHFRGLKLRMEKLLCRKSV